MQENAKVFSSDITRGQKPLQNNLYDLVAVTTATPINVREVREYDCGFQPKTNKYYVPKRRTKPISKVKTVRDIRKFFETDVYSDLTKDLEKQQNFLLKKITCGSSREENTKSIAKSMLKCDKPVSRSSWQMLMNLNPHGCAHAIQYVLWNGRCIRVNGSKGGSNKFLCNYDLGKNKIVPKKEKKNFNKQRGLLRNSLNIKFKPGPLARKKKLDESYQKYNVGDIELMDLPRTGLDVQPKYGVQLEPSITKLVHSLRDVNGVISEKWAEFSVSVLGDLKNNEVMQNNDVSTVSFELKYKCDQRRLLMRHDIDISREIGYELKHSQHQINSISVTTEEIETILSQIIDSVEISLMQDSLYTGEDEPRECSLEINIPKVNTIIKEKNKKRYSELDRLDVTVIRLPEAPHDDIPQICGKASCSLGCVCASLECSYNLKQHCGRLECMFDCKCDFSKYRAMDSFESDCPEFIPGLINLDNELSLKLAKEEQKFHQTVVLTGEKSVVLKSEKRNWKATKRYRNFYNKMCLKSEAKPRGMLSVVDVKLNLKNVEPWCMVHNLYKCFCKGIFTENINLDMRNEVEMIGTVPNNDSNSTKNVGDLKDTSLGTERKSTEKITNKDPKTIFELRDVIDMAILNSNNNTCARARPYEGRKYDNFYYFNTNKKIKEMEENDEKLKKRMISILSNFDNDESRINNDTNSQSLNETQDNESRTVISDSDENCDTNEENSLGSLAGSIEYSLSLPQMAASTSKNQDQDNITPDKSILSHATNKTKLIAWLEASYKQYKKRLEHGIVKKSLEPPKHGKVALYPWEFILSRYRERKNLFMISKEKPFRIFMAVDARNNFFANCINIDDIRFAELQSYPVTVKNLLTNATEIKDNFCILCGLTHCWELIGSVTKIDDPVSGTEPSKSVVEESETQVSKKDKVQVKPKIRRSKRKKSSKKKALTKALKETMSNINEDYHESAPTSLDSPESSNNSKEPLKDDAVLIDDVLPERELQSQEENNGAPTEISRWFIMTVENDFTEIQFYKRGFFVKYESIIKAINVARISEKTVRLSSQKCADPNAGPQFGIYAIPNANEYCVFVGPYDKDEPLGIETVKSLSDIGRPKSTRGVWITVKKVDNLKLIDNPLSFLPAKDVDPSKIVSLENNLNIDNTTEGTQFNAQDKELLIAPKKAQTKVVKPITIRKANGFFQLAPQGILKPIEPKSYARAKITFTPSNRLDTIIQPILFKNTENETQMPVAITKVPALIPFKSAMANSHFVKTFENVPQNPKPIAEIAPQIKIVDVYSEKVVNTERPRATVNSKSECVLILKPEEINQRLMENRLPLQVSSKSQEHVKETQSKDSEQDIENFLATSSVCIPPNADIYEISDDEDSGGIPENQNCWIECKNIEHLGYIRAKKDKDNRLSFEFPGFKFTDYYDEAEAFLKINQVLSRKIYVPKRIDIQWRVVYSADELKGKKELTAEDLGSDFVLTKQGLRHKKLLMASLRRKNAQVLTDSNSLLKDMLMTNEDLDKAIDIIIDLDDQSKNLEEEGDILMNEMANAKETLGGQNTSPHFAVREEHQATLQNISKAMSNV